jgi:acyl-CoA thioester hydrolase
MTATETEVPITWGDTDAGGLIYFPRVFHLFVVGLNDHVGATDHLMERLRAEGHALPVVEADAEFAAPLRAGDTAVVTTTVTSAGESSFTPVFEVRRAADDAVTVSGSATFVLVDDAFEPTPLPDWIRDALA